MNENAFDSLQKTLSNPNLTEDEKTKIIKDFGENYRKQIDKELNIYLAKQYGGAALEIASAAIPGTGIGKIGGKVAEKILSKSIGRKLSNYIGEGIFSEAASGGIFGTGRGLMENQNPLYTAIEDATVGGLIGGVSSSVYGKYLNDLRIKDINSINELRKIWGIPFRKASGNIEKAINTLIENKQGFVPNAFYKNGIGNVNILWGNSNMGLQHIIERRNSQGIDVDKFLKDLPNVIKKGKVYDKKKHLDRKYIGNEKSEVAIRNQYIIDNKEYNAPWLASSYNLLKKPQATSGFHSREIINFDKQPDSRIELEINNIINDTIQKNNLDKWLFSNPSIPLSIHHNLPEIPTVDQTQKNTPEFFRQPQFL